MDGEVAATAAGSPDGSGFRAVINANAPGALAENRVRVLACARGGIVACWIARLLPDHRSARVERTPQPRYLSSRIEGVNVIPTNIPSGVMKRLTVWPHGSLLFFTSIR